MGRREKGTGVGKTKTSSGVGWRLDVEGGETLWSQDRCRLYREREERCGEISQGEGGGRGKAGERNIQCPLAKGFPLAGAD